MLPGALLQVAMVSYSNLAEGSHHQEIDVRSYEIATPAPLHREATPHILCGRAPGSDEGDLWERYDVVIFDETPQQALNILKDTILLAEKEICSQNNTKTCFATISPSSLRTWTTTANRTNELKQPVMLVARLKFSGFFHVAIIGVGGVPTSQRLILGQVKKNLPYKKNSHVASCS